MEVLKDILHLTKAFLRLPIKIVSKLFGKIAEYGWRKTLLAFLVFLVLISVTSTAFIEITSQPQFCVSCHYMKPYFTSWETSSHKDVACTKCHFPPGIKHTIEGKFTALSMLVNYTTGIYKRSKPWAEISDASCLRGGCHDTRLLDGRVEYLQDIIFDHKPHLSEQRLGKNLRCTSCHSQIVQGEHISVTSSTCFLCHFKGASSDRMSNCTTCHDAPVKNALHPDVPFDHTEMVANGVNCNRCHGAMQSGSGDVDKERCNSCHAELGKVERFDDTEFIHDQHITKRKVDCQACHQVILHKSVSRTEQIKPQCEDCHQNFHEVQVALFTGKGGKGVEESPSTMFESGLNCRGCHIIEAKDKEFEFSHSTMQASGVVCSPCHDAGYDKILVGWKRRNQERLGQIHSIHDKVKRAVQGLNGVNRSVADSLLNVANHNISLVELGHGIHNIPYAEALLAGANEQLRSAAKLAGGVSLPSFSSGLPNQGSECMNCHYGVETMTVKRAGRDFPHANHVLVQKLDCNFCHNNEKKHGELTLNSASCNSCHHKTDGNVALDCNRCHTMQYSLYSGDKLWGEDAVPDVMSEGGVGCRDCHEGEKGIARPTGEVCATCHDETYSKLMDGWQFEIRNQLVRADSLLHLCRNIDLPELEARRLRIKQLEKDGSLGAHNYPLIQGVLSRDIDWLQNFVHENKLDLSKSPHSMKSE